MQSNQQQRPVQYPWGTQCPLRWPKVFLVARVPDSTRALEAVSPVFPNYEILASGEILFDLTRQQRAFRSPVQMGHALMTHLRESFPGADGMTLSAGLAADAFTGLYAARLCQDDLQLVPAWDARRVLSSAPVEHLDGLITGVSTLLREMGYRQLGDLSRQREPVLTQRYGELGRAVHLLAKGQSVPRQYWYLSPPRLLAVAGRVSGGDFSRCQEQIYGVRQRLERQFARLGLEAGLWRLSCRDGEGRFVPVASLAEGWLLTDIGFLDFRWQASDWRHRRVQCDLFDLDAPTGDPIVMPLQSSTGSTVLAS
ncbi:MAG: hypothetical protein ACQES2_09250 [Pseudomonadota bacterium]